MDQGKEIYCQGIWYYDMVFALVYILKNTELKILSATFNKQYKWTIPITETSMLQTSGHDTELFIGYYTCIISVMQKFRTLNYAHCSHSPVDKEPIISRTVELLMS